MLRLLRGVVLAVGLAACTAERVPVAWEQDGVLVDHWDRQLLVRGVNARVEGLFDVSFDDGRVPLEAIPPFGVEDCRFLARGLGMNLLRLPVNWSGIEPERDVFDDAYLDAVFALVDDCYAEGVYTIVDLHQDAYSKEIGEDGAPLWAISPPPTELLQGPLDDLDDRRSSEQVLAAFASLFDDVDGLVDEYADMSAALARPFAEHPGAIALELMNEPVAINRQDELDAFHQRVSARVREVAPEVTLAFEPESQRNFSDVGVVEEVFAFDDALYAPHLYTDVFEDGWASEDEAAVHTSIDAALAEATQHRSGLFVGEFGHDPRTERGRRYIRTCLDGFDRVEAHWAFWVYEEYSQGSWGLFEPALDGEGMPLATRGSLRPEALELLARPFPQATAGRLESIDWDDEAATLSVSLSDVSGRRGRAAEHVVSAPTQTWPRGVAVTCDGEAVAVDLRDGRARFRCAGTGYEVAPSAE